MSRRINLALVVLCLALTATSCEAGSPKTPKVVADWSRGQQLGVSALNQPIDMLSSNARVHMIWVAIGGKALQYVRLDPSAKVEANVTLEIGGAHPSDPQLILHPDSSFGALWTDNPNIPRALFVAWFSQNGQLLSGPTQISPAGARVSDYAVAHNIDGSQDIFWADEIPTDGGIHHLRLSSDGQASDDRLLIKGVAYPTLQVAPDGTVHLAWVEEPSMRENDVYYAVFDPSTSEVGDKTKIAMYRTATGMVFHPPTLGLDHNMVYLFWSLEQRGGGLTPGEAATYSVSFPLGNPSLREPVRVEIPGVARPTYDAAVGELPYGQLASGDGWSSPLIYMPATLAGQKQELGLFLVAQVETSRQTSREVAWCIFADGQFRGYQLPARVDNALRPVGTLDSAGNAHLAWLGAGGFGRYEVYYASTSPQVKANLDRVTIQDRALDVLNTLWSLAPALGFFPPVFLLWTFASFAWVILFYFVRVEGGLDRRSSRVALVVAILLYLFSKLFLMPGVVLSYAPFLDRVPANLQFLPVIGTPIVTALMAIGVVWLYFRRRQYRSLLAAYLIFVATDALLSLIIYVPRWLAG
jgi:hypothetical protein